MLVCLYNPLNISLEQKEAPPTPDPPRPHPPAAARVAFNPYHRWCPVQGANGFGKFGYRVNGGGRLKTKPHIVNQETDSARHLVTNSSSLLLPALAAATYTNHIGGGYQLSACKKNKVTPPQITGMIFVFSSQLIIAKHLS